MSSNVRDSRFELVPNIASIDWPSAQFAPPYIVRAKAQAGSEVPPASFSPPSLGPQEISPLPESLFEGLHPRYLQRTREVEARLRQPTSSEELAHLTQQRIRIHALLVVRAEQRDKMRGMSRRARHRAAHTRLWVRGR